MSAFDPDARMLENPDTRALQEFSQRVHVDLASCWLALPKIKEWGLSLDHPRAAKIARGEANRSKRAEWSPGSLSFDNAETMAASAGGTGDAKMDDLIDRCRSAAADETCAPGQILDADDQDALISRMMRLKAALKPRDRERLEMRFEKGMSIQEIAVALGVADKTIYKSIERMKDILRAALERSDWEDAHNGLRLAGAGAPAAVVLDKTGQLGWDLDAQEVQP